MSDQRRLVVGGESQASEQEFVNMADRIEAAEKRFSRFERPRPLMQLNCICNLGANGESVPSQLGGVWPSASASCPHDTP